MYVPAGDNLHFTFMPFNMSGLSNVTFTIDGTILVSTDNINWPNYSDRSNSAHDFWHLTDSENIHIRGEGEIQGQGYWWWMREYINSNKFGRPHILRMERVRHCIIEGVDFLNSPFYHLYLTDIDDFLIQDFEIMVDILEQKKLAVKHGKFDY